MQRGARLVGAVMRHSIWLVAMYGLGVGFVLLFVASPTLVDIVSACKVVSLLALVYANRETPESIDIDHRPEVSAINFAIIGASALVLLMMVVKIVVDDHAMVTIAPAGQIALIWFSANAYWVSTLPVFGYFALDFYIALGRGSSPQDREAAWEFVIFRDLVCIAPLALVLALAEVYTTFSPLPDAAQSAEFFFGGALTVILLGSAVATKALNVSQAHRREAGTVRPTPLSRPMPVSAKG
ncbi:hypothetical protein [Rubrimonas cliftonensis]|uniref:Uncharacterized protein n=1 Tax=Rubrimonas cliftonensis TaxID=89524 RepID=A0A1H4BZX8_9RHOB|nr:hypothetical protein [Rubrimonas cliftonensis]SEA53627.1 hypothetical protein SAMN05444370_106130 [Rubrimonas cliftonensis]